MIVPAPRNPIPETICAAMRPGSAMLTCRSAYVSATWIDTIVISVDPMQISMFVRRPAGLSWSSRSNPITAPHAAARSSFSHVSGTSSESPRTRTILVKKATPPSTGIATWWFLRPPSGRSMKPGAGASRRASAVSTRLNAKAVSGRARRTSTFISTGPRFALLRGFEIAGQTLGKPPSGGEACNSLLSRTS